MKKVFFADVKQDILKALNNLPKDVGITEKVGLVDGFVSNPVTGEVTNSLMIGGPTLPMIVVIGEKSGRVYFFALKILLPNIKI